MLFIVGFENPWRRSEKERPACIMGQSFPINFHGTVKLTSEQAVRMYEYVINFPLKSVCAFASLTLNSVNIWSSNDYSQRIEV